LRAHLRVWIKIKKEFIYKILRITGFKRHPHPLQPHLRHFMVLMKLCFVGVNAHL
jgi:hypothetical protein